MPDLTPAELAILKLFAQRLYDDPDQPPLSYGAIINSGIANRNELRDAFRSLVDRHCVFCGATLQWQDDSPCVLTPQAIQFAQKLLLSDIKHAKLIQQSLMQLARTGRLRSGRRVKNLDPDLGGVHLCEGFEPEYH